MLAGMPWYHFLAWQRASAVALLIFGASAGRASVIKDWLAPVWLWWICLGLGLASSVRPLESLQLLLWSVVLPLGVAATLAQMPAMVRLLLPVYLLALLGLVGMQVLMLIEGVDMQVGAPAGWRYYPGPGLSSSFLVLAFPVAWAVFFRSQGALRLLAALSLLALPAGVYMTLNRMAWLVLAVAFVVLLTLSVAQTSWRRRGQLLLLGLLIISLCGGLAWKATRERMGPTSMEQVYTQDARHGVWRYWWSQVPSSPWWGHGYGIRVQQAYYRDQGGIKSLPESLRPYAGAIVAHGHNAILDALVQTGILGTLGWLLALAGYAVRFWRQRSRADAPIVAAALALILSLLLKNMTDDFVEFGLSLQFWSLLGLLQAFSSDCKKAASSSASTG